MGFILSKFRKKKSTLEVLEQLEAEMASISKFKASTVVWQKKVVGYLVTYSIVVYLLLAMLVYFKLFPAAVNRQEQLLLLLPFLVFPGLIWGLRKFLTWWYHRKVRRDDMKLEALKEKKTKILDDVMEKETYKVAKEILDKFGQTQPVGRPTGAGTGRQVGAVGGVQDDNAQLRRRAGPVIQPAGRLNTSLPVTAIAPARTASSNTKLNTSMAPAARTVQGPGVPQGPSGEGGAAPPIFPPRPQGPGGLSRSAPGPPLPRPVLPRERGYMDKFVEFLVGDGPANRFALICRQCQSHNGMALREEFEYVAYRCCYCYYWNPARKQRPVAPRLPEQTALTSPTDSSSGSDLSGTSSAAQSRRESGVGIEEVEVEETSRVVDTVDQKPFNEIENVGIQDIGKPLNDPTDDEDDIEIVNKEDDFDINHEMIHPVLKDLDVKLDEEKEEKEKIDHIKEDGDGDAMEVDK